jgi:hypothetical protein
VSSFSALKILNSKLKSNLLSVSYNIVDKNFDSRTAPAQLLYVSLKKPSVLNLIILIRDVFYHLKVMLKVSDESITKWLQKVK